MRWLCRLGLHWWSCYPQATELRDLRAGRVWCWCDWGHHGELRQVGKP